MNYFDSTFSEIRGARSPHRSCSAVSERSEDEFLELFPSEDDEETDLHEYDSELDLIIPVLRPKQARKTDP